MSSFRRRADAVDAAIADWMHRYGHVAHRLPLAVLFFWFGVLKLVGAPSATSIIARTVYVLDPSVGVPLLGLWEAVIGACLLWKPLFRVALLLLAIRLPGTFVALVVHPDVTFVAPFVPTVEGAYLIKDLLLFGAALIIGGTVRRRPAPGHLH